MNYDNIIKKINPGWNKFIEANKKELEEIITLLNSDSNVIYPREKDIFRSLFYFPPSEIKLVILGQDPYINEENNIPQACGLSFSVPSSHKKIPPSLQNIFKEIKNNYPDYMIPENGSLKKWVKNEKILLLNATLTVIKGKSNSHMNIWKNYTDKMIKYISETNDKTIFLLMGNFAIGKGKLIDSNKHKIFTTKHPSPLSAYSGFFGSNIFKQINDYLEENNVDTIKW